MGYDVASVLQVVGWALAVVVALALLASAVGTLREYERAVVFRLGRFNRRAGPGLYLKMPFLEVTRVVDTRVVTRQIQRQKAITSDNVPLSIDAVVWTRTVDPERSVIAIVDSNAAIDQFAATALRNVIGQHSLGDVLRDQERIAATLRSRIDQITEPWGLKVEQVEIRNIEMPESMERAMAQEAEATREKKARVIKAEGEEEASHVLARAASNMAGIPGGLQLRQLQTITEVGAENNTTIIMMMPVELLQGIGGLAGIGAALAATAKAQPAPEAPTRPVEATRAA